MILGFGCFYSHARGGSLWARLRASHGQPHHNALLQVRAALVHRGDCDDLGFGDDAHHHHRRLSQQHDGRGVVVTVRVSEQNDGTAVAAAARSAAPRVAMPEAAQSSSAMAAQSGSNMAASWPGKVGTLNTSLSLFSRWGFLILRVPRRRITVGAIALLLIHAGAIGFSRIQVRRNRKITFLRQGN
jgi:hypothetical protein